MTLSPNMLPRCRRKVGRAAGSAYTHRGSRCVCSLRVVLTAGKAIAGSVVNMGQGPRVPSGSVRLAVPPPRLDDFDDDSAAVRAQLCCARHAPCRPNVMLCLTLSVPACVLPCAVGAPPVVTDRIAWADVRNGGFCSH